VERATSSDGGGARGTERLGVAARPEINGAENGPFRRASGTGAVRGKKSTVCPFSPKVWRRR